jgi:hypothetical protein
VAEDVITYEATMGIPGLRVWTIRMPIYKHQDLDRILENSVISMQKGR